MRTGFLRDVSSRIGQPLILLQGVFHHTQKASIGLCLAAVAILGFVDYLTGYVVSFSIFYVFPVLICVWNHGFRRTVPVAAAAAFIWQASNLAAGESFSTILLPIWNATARLLYFLLLSYLLDALKTRLALEAENARVDYLTGLLNRRAFEEALARENMRAQRFRHPLTLAFIDIDNFKQVNDHHGHAEGDRALRCVAETIRANVRDADIAARLGGDEFAVIYVEDAPDAAEQSVHRLKDALDAAAQERGWPIGFTMGVLTSTTGFAGDVGDILAAADRLMYDGKTAGKAQVMMGAMPRTTEGERPRPRKSGPAAL